MIFAAFAFSLVFVASSFVTGSRFNFAAITTGAWMHQSGIGFWKECGSGIRAVVSSVMYFVVFAGVHYANPPGRYGVHYVEEVMEDGGNQGVKVAETQVKVAETQVKASETQVKLGESGVKSSETQVKVDESL
ncbi:hypothetical protein M5689_008188 [Euphorbia peplus]|nr:hypothetical protein M5689_008188 [Euphorbia peplus]